MTNVSNQEKAKVEKEAQRKARKDGRNAKRMANEGKERAWTEAKRQQKKEMEEWTDEDKQLRAEGVPDQQRPQKPPKMVKKADFFAALDAVAAEDEYDGDGDGDGEDDEGDVDDDVDGTNAEMS